MGAKGLVVGSGVEAHGRQEVADQGEGGETPEAGPAQPGCQANR